MAGSRYHWEPIANDYHSPLLRNAIFIQAFAMYPRLHGIPSVAIGVVSRNDQIEYLTDLRTWGRAHRALAGRAEQDIRIVERIIRRSLAWGESFDRWTERLMRPVSVRRSTNARLVALLAAFLEKQKTLYGLGTVLPILDFQGFSFVEGAVRAYLNGRLDTEAAQRAFGVFTQPSLPSFAQDEARALLKLAIRFWRTPGWRRAVLLTPFPTLAKHFPVFGKALRHHADAWAWVYYVYDGPAYGPEMFLELLRDALRKGDPRHQLAEERQQWVRIASAKRGLLARLKPAAYHRRLLLVAGEFVWAKPRRKDLQSRAYYDVRVLIEEIGRRLSLTPAEVKSTPFAVVRRALLSDVSVPRDIPRTARRFHVCLPDGRGGLRLLIGPVAERFARTHIIRQPRLAVDRTRPLTGTCACPGLAQGRVRIINRPEDMGKMRVGDVLVSTATTPNIVAAMKKASAIITDEGGLTCHAAIVSRELGTPCVVGTKIATKVLRDGDRVEVDATKGIVRRLGT